MSGEAQTSYATCGRPRKEISMEDVERLRKRGFKWNEIAHLMSVSSRTLRTFRQDNGMGIGKESYSSLTDDSLEAENLAIFRSHGHSK